MKSGKNITNDSFKRDEDGSFYFAARNDDIVISEGYNIAGPKVEAALLSHRYESECSLQKPKVKWLLLALKNANLLISAVDKADVKDADAFREALKAAEFDSTRGDFKFGSNKLLNAALVDHSDVYAADCKM